MQIHLGALLAIPITGVDPQRVLAHALGKSGYVPFAALPRGYLRQNLEVVEGLYRETAAGEPGLPRWGLLLPQQPRTVFALARELAQAGADLVFALATGPGERACLKVYAGKDVKLKAGADPDDEFAYRILVSEDEAPYRELAEALHLPEPARRAWLAWGTGARRGPLNPGGLDAALGLPTRPLGFSEAGGAAAPAPWRHWLYVDRRSPLISNA